MTVAAAYLGEPWRLPIQLGALYCLFTIYMYQIEEPKIKVIFVIKISIFKNLVFLFS
jgi:hypothetical protein